MMNNFKLAKITLCTLATVICLNTYACGITSDTQTIVGESTTLTPVNN